MLHSGIHSVLGLPENSSFHSTTLGKEIDAKFMFFPYQDDLATDTKTLIMNIQGCFLKYIYQMNSGCEHAVIALIDKSYGPVFWCQQLFSSTPKDGITYHNVLNRQLGRLVSLIDPKLHLKAYLKVLDIALHSPLPEWQLSLEMLCHALLADCDEQAFYDSSALAKMFLRKSVEESSPLSKHGLVLLSERMLKHAERSSLIEDISFWSEKLISHMEQDASLRSTIDRATLLISQSDSANLNSCISHHVASLRNACRELPSDLDYNTLLRNIHNLRRVGQSRMAIDQNCGRIIGDLMAALLSLFSKLAKSFPESVCDSSSTAALKTIESWVSATHGRRPHIGGVADLEQFEICLEVIKQYNISAKFFYVLLYNAAGSLYTRKEFEAAAQLLELCFGADYEAARDTRKVEYLWSAYLQCSNAAKAYQWLSAALRLILDAPTVVSDHLLSEVTGVQSDLHRVITKLTVLVIDHPEFEFPRYDMFTPEVEGIVLEIYISQLPTQRKPSDRIAQLCVCAITILLQLYASQEYGPQRLRSLTSSLGVFRFCEDFEHFRRYLDLTRTYRSWFSAKDLPDIVTLYANLFLIYNITEHNQSGIYQIVDDMCLLVERLNLTQQRPALVVLQILELLVDETARMGLSLDFLRSTELLIRVTRIVKAVEDPGLIKLELDAAEEYLNCGYDGRANICLCRASKSMQSTQPGPLLGARYLYLQTRYFFAVGDAGKILTQLSSIEQLLDASQDSACNSEIRAFALASISLYAEIQGFLAPAIRYELEALALLRKACQRHAKHQINARTDSIKAITTQLKNLSIRPCIKSSGSILRCLLRLAHLYERLGAIKDALYYCDEAENAATELHNQFWLSAARVVSARTSFQANKINSKRSAEATEALQLQNPVHVIQSSLLFARKLAAVDEEAGIGHLENAVLLSRKRDLSRLSFAWTTSMTPAEVTHDNNRRPVKKKPESMAGKLATSALLLQAQEAEILCILYDLYRRRERHIDKARCITEIEQLRESESSSGRASLTLAVSKLHEAKSLLVADPVYGVLEDSALSLPSVCNILPISSHPRKARPKQKKAGAIDVEQGVSDDVKRLIVESKSLVTSDFEQCLVAGSSHEVYGRSSLYNSLSLLHSALVDPAREAPLKSSASNYLLEISRAIPVNREQERRDDTLHNANKTGWTDGLLALRDVRTMTQPAFQADYIDIIPENWNVVSLGLSAENTDLVVSRMQPNRSPLILRLPMSRHNSRDIDEDTFEYAEAKKELSEIIELSDASAQEAKNIKSAKGKTEWWTSRQNLDTRLGTLLENIEHCWLGGFRGVLSASLSHPSAFEQFRSSFAKVIVKHIPFRKDRPFDLDSRALDLFTDLGSVQDDESLELLEDLLYFVLDIYQFHGESIAYDEIDIDQMVVDVQALLHNYHQKICPAASNQHTVLILDKSLHAFPWESLPCLRGKSISRVPSLCVLKSLLASHTNPEYICIPRENGRFVLNPGGDLKTTEHSLSQKLSRLPNWSGIVAKQPQESEIAEFLETSSIYMYFGHGGGEQYIRPGRIKKLCQCAVSILMGCSSGALKDQGIYDPWGTPYNFMVAKWYLYIQAGRRRVLTLVVRRSWSISGMSPIKISIVSALKCFHYGVSSLVRILHILCVARSRKVVMPV